MRFCLHDGNSKKCKYARPMAKACLKNPSYHNRHLLRLKVLFLSRSVLARQHCFWFTLIRISCFLNCHKCSGSASVARGLYNAVRCFHCTAHKRAWAALCSVNNWILKCTLSHVGDIPYWIVQNSWGTTWGDKGYVYIKVGSNICGK